MVERKTGRRMSVARQILLLQLALLALVIGVGAALAVVDERRDSDDAIRRQVSSIAQTLALSDSTAAALTSPDPTAILQPQTEKIRQATGVDFIVVMAPDRTRFTHTSPELIGQLFTGNIDRALAGATFTETYAGSLGPSIRAVTPVYDSGGTLVGPGFCRCHPRADQQASSPQSVPVILFVAGGGLLAALLSSLLVSRRIRRQTLGMAPDELRTMYEHHDAVLHSIGEGLGGDRARPKQRCASGYRQRRSASPPRSTGRARATFVHPRDHASRRRPLPRRIKCTSPTSVCWWSTNTRLSGRATELAPC